MRLYGFPPSIIYGLVNKPAIIPMVPNDKGVLEQNIFYNSDQCTFD